MKIYRVHYYDPEMGCRGFDFFADEKSARSAAWKYYGDYPAHERKQPEPIEIASSPTKVEILRLLNEFATHPNNG